ncbi:dihydrolipoyllysine-residue acetyltransferase [Deinococcus ruber]|uniref:Acetyltransferase component of pyruvate dehydrogenase complex n=1 Tax=Deinococcus ruber TaxID=1848197 RepID=A0A918KWD4_9DEIO|nr:dihydrolipoyllysine-residue acetyltransferase [Deinococcus ruber]GGR37018.1 acetyltransferase component of pyruvate dehydrogenase complex [Deinococcus ruber]
MPTNVTLPEVGDNIEQGTVVTVLVKAGDTITEGQAIIEIETDKAVVEVPSSTAGTVAEVLVKEGDSVQVGGVILTLQGGTDAAPAAPTPEAEPDVAPVAPDAATAQNVAQAQQAAQKEQPAPAAPAAPALAASSQEVTLPEVGDNVEQGTVVTVLVKAGDTISEGQAIIEIETDKAVVEVPSSAAGTVAEVRVKEGDTVKVGGVILTLQGGAATSGGPSADFQQPQSAFEAGTAQDSQGAGEQPAAENPTSQGTQNPQTYEARTFDGRPVIHAAPSVRRLARELGVDIAQVRGSGPAGRVSEDDVRAFQKGGSVAPAAAAPTQTAPAQPAVAQASAVQTAVQPQVAASAVSEQTPASPASPVIKLPDFEKWGTVRREDMSGIRKATVRSMSNAWASVPMVTQFDKADVTRMEEVRKQFAARVEKAGGKLTMTHILMKVVAGALRKFPKFGASLDLANNQVIYKDYVNLGVAVDTPVGLLVPVLKDADRKSITEIVLELNELAGKARDRKLKPDEMAGATFTISNLGGIGGYAFTPIVNPPEVAILGVSRGGFEPVWNKDTQSFEPRNMLPLSLSYDHRLIDGADAARFVRYICETLEDPFLISL